MRVDGGTTCGHPLLPLVGHALRVMPMLGRLAVSAPRAAASSTVRRIVDRTPSSHGLDHPAVRAVPQGMARNDLRAVPHLVFGRTHCRHWVIGLRSLRMLG
ncbi:MAG: hypothetical protein WKF73_18140 [Nocardioidaceae bacterium]